VILPDLTRQDRDAAERMDAPDCDRTALERTYAHFRTVNAVVAGWRPTYRRHLRPVLRRDRVTTVLDIGSGGGDLPRALARWAGRDGYRVQITAVDPDPRAHGWATAQPPVEGITYRRAFSHDLVAEGRTFDVVISNHLLHHLDDAGRRALLADSERLARHRVVHSDIARSRWAYFLFAVGTWAFFRDSFIREDGLTSIRRSYTAEELAAAVPSGWRIERRRPWRLLLIHEPGRAGTE
jgi:2-polyprenyl-3-methyl-5-hydroxy-6-metoxy-1,4-benzoquinol methylase